MPEADFLPQGWFKTTISELCILNPKHSKDIDDATEISFIPMASVSDKTGEIIDFKIRKLGEIRKGYTHFSENDVIWAKITPCMENGKAALAKELKNGLACGSTEFYVLRSKGGLTPELLYYYVRQGNFRRDAKMVMGGAVGHQRVPKNFLLNRKFLLPPIQEQKRIINKIEALQAKSTKAKQALDAAKPLLDKLRQSILASAFRGDLTADWRKKNPDVELASVLLERIRVERRKKWEENELVKMRAKGKEPTDDKWKSKYKEPEPADTKGLLGLPDGWLNFSTDQIFYFVTSGSRGWAKYYSEKGDIFIRIGNLDRCSINLDLRNIIFVSPPKGAEGVRTQVQRNDILVSITADIGIISIIPEKFPTAYINQHISLARPVDMINAKYLAWYLSSKEGQTQFQDLKRGATKAGLGLDDIRSVIVPIPSIKEQEKVVEQIEEKYRSIQMIEKKIEQSLRKTENLDQSILVKAFKGGLVSQDPSDEPAALLLERILNGIKK